MNSTTSLRLPIPLSQEAHATASQFAAEQVNPRKGKQVYLNTLAVYAVHTYLKWLEIETDLSQGDSWQPGLRAMFNVADLIVPGVGKLECCPILPGETVAVVPEDVLGDRMGYVAVQFGQQLDSVELLGFVRDTDEPAFEAREVQLEEFNSLGLDPLLDALYPSEAIVNLRQWLENNFSQVDWKSPELLIPSRFRGATSGSRGVRGGASVPPEMFSQVTSVSRAKAIALGSSPKLTVILVVQVISQTTEENILNVRLRLYPDVTSENLTRDLKVTVLDESGLTCLEAQPRDSDVWLELELLDCHPSERFNVQLTLGEAIVIEEFMV